MEEEIELAKEEMEKGIASLKNNLSTLRTGRASVSMLDNIQVEYYGDMIALNQIASVTIPEARQLLIKPYDKNDAKAIVSALNASSLGITPINDGNVIRLNIPALTEERRREIAKTAKKYSEEGKVVIRNARRDCLDMIKNAEYPEDMEKKLQADVQKLTDEYCKKIDEEYASKEKENDYQRTIAMFPYHFSADVASLIEGSPKLARTFYFEIDKNGEVVKERFIKSVIRNNKKMTYDEVNDILKNKTDDKVLQETIDNLEEVTKLLDSKHHISELYKKIKENIKDPSELRVKKVGAENIVYQAMLLTGNRVAEFFS